MLGFSLHFHYWRWRWWWRSVLEGWYLSVVHFFLVPALATHFMIQSITYIILNLIIISIWNQRIKMIRTKLLIYCLDSHLLMWFPPKPLPNSTPTVCSVRVSDRGYRSTIERAPLFIHGNNHSVSRSVANKNYYPSIIIIINIIIINSIIIVIIIGDGGGGDGDGCGVVVVVGGGGGGSDVGCK